ncbi:MAG: hypothetical protein IPI38_14945 [Gemmatimonadetes bacterium]|nr:hypothetical protein [Gemmatimonadota bacterium]MBK6780146.1 hypothetical protein [Gemmatimonadota bacterium]MBK7350887.1 hypothetical protein [Gemmatimonadota bacterium]MBK7716702.1 hypothetical protein [Gemmatimonadota bacterium]MBK7786047.1 hypothetical protein [Gemmatimonadota bacterium]
MRTGGKFLVALGLVAACTTDGVGPASQAVQGSGGAGTASLRGVVFTVRNGPDSTRVPVAGATVTLVRVGDLPVDSTPPDTMLWSGGLRLDRLGFLDSVPTDTIPTDTIPTDTIPTDTIPTDTIPTDTNPPPPPPACRDGVVVATVRSNAAGRYEASRLRPGVYTIEVEPPAGSPLSPNAFCGVPVRRGVPTRFDAFLWRGPGPDPIPGDST